MLVQPVFTNTPKDIPWLLMVALTSHCVNHLVLFRWVETAVNQCRVDSSSLLVDSLVKGF